MSDRGNYTRLDRPSEVVLAARVARDYYLEGISKVDIAERLGISRFRVARLLDAARASGMVRIEIGLPGGDLDADLSAKLCSALGLRQAFVFNFPDAEPTLLRHRLGEATGQALMDLLTPKDILGLSWSRTLSGLTAALTEFPPCPIVQLTGAVPPGGCGGGVRASTVGDRRGGRDRRLGTGPVHDLRGHNAGRTGCAGRSRGMCRGSRGVHRARRQASEHAD
jgi:Putative sugar-binding domain